MQQHSQIIEQIKDRLVQALDEQYNVKDIHEVNRIIGTLERTHVTREDLEKTRLGKYINELRRKTTDKELAKRTKKLIKSWRNLTVGGNGSSNASSALTSPFTNSNSIISPQNYSNDSNSFASCGNSYAPSSVGNAINNSNSNGSNGSSRGANSLSGPGNNNHPALARIRSQHITSPAERTSAAKQFSQQNSLSPKVSPVLSGGARSLNASSFRPHSQTTSLFSRSNLSPSVKESGSLSGHHHPANGFKSSASNNHQASSNSHRITPPTRNHSNLTSPVNSSITTSSTKANGHHHLSSPGLYNSFKNILSNDGASRTISPNTFRQRNTPPTPNSSSNLKLSSSVINIDSASSSRHCSPLAFTFSADSRDSTSFSNKNSYSNQDEFSALDTNDEDSSSSVFSSLSTGTPMPGSNKQTEPGKKRGRKRKIESESDALRENLNSIMNSGGGRRLQSTSELVQQKFNIKVNPNILQQQQTNSHSKYNSLSASSSPLLPIGGKHSPDPPIKRAKRSNGIDSVNLNGHHHNNLLDDFKSAISHRNKSLPASPALSSLKNSNHLVSRILSPIIQSPEDSYIDDDDVEYDDEFSQQYVDDDDDEDNIDNSRNRFPTIKIKPLTGFGKLSKSEAEPAKNDDNLFTVNKVDEEIKKIYSLLPKVSEEDVDFMKQFKFDEDENNNQTIEPEADELIKAEPISEETACEVEVDSKASSARVKDESAIVEEDDSEYELFAYNELYDEEEDEEVEVTDDDELSDCNDQGDDQQIKLENHHKVNDDDELSGGDESPLHEDSDEKEGVDEEHTLMGDIQKCDTISTTLTRVDAEENDKLPTNQSSSSDLLVTKDENQPCSSTSNDDEEETAVSSSQQEPDSTTATVTDDDELKQPTSRLESSSTDSDNIKKDVESDVPTVVSSSVPDSNESDDLASTNNNNWAELLGIDELYRQDHCVDDILLKYSQQQFDCFVDQQQQPEEPSELVADDNLMETSVVQQDVSSEPAKSHKKHTKIVVRRVLRQKLRKCFVRSTVKKSLVDRMANEQWEFINGTYDKDGVWHDFGEMTSVLVLANHPVAPRKTELTTINDSAAAASSEEEKNVDVSSLTNPDDDNVLHILPYVNYSW